MPTCLHPLQGVTVSKAIAEAAAIARVAGKPVPAPADSSRATAKVKP